MTTKRLAPEREAELRAFVAGEHASFAWRELFDEIDALRAQLAHELAMDVIPVAMRDAEQRGREAERADVVAHLKALAAGLGANLFETHAKNTLGLVARQIGRGEHVKGRG